MTALVSTRQERPLFFPAGEHTLFGILTQPATNPKGIAVVILPGGTNLSMNVNGLSVRFCRRVARHGFHALRFDYHGVGESSGRPDRVDLASPFVSDLDGALASLRAHGIERFVLVGSCFGARTVLAGTPTTDGLVGVVLISPPVRDFEMGELEVTRMAAELSVGDFARRAVSARALSGLLKADRRRTYYKLVREKLRERRGRSSERAADRKARYAISPRFLEPLRDLVSRGSPVLFIYGDGDDLWGEFQRGRATSPLAEVLGTATISSTTLPGRVHGFSDSRVADGVFDFVADWIVELPAVDGMQPAGQGRNEGIP